MAVPLRFNQRCFGVLALANPADRQPFGETEFELMKWLGEQAALALHNADYLNLHVERQQLDLDLELASSVQQMILPGRAPSVPGLDIDLRYAAAQKVGGDLYDLFELPDGRLGVAIADVSGKGIPASLLMAICRSYLRLIAPRHSSPAAALRELNAAMQGDVQPGSFVTLIYCIVDPLTGSLTFARAGHELPLLARCREGLGARCVVAYVESEGMPVGLVPSEVFDSMIEDFSTEFDEGDIFLLYTDGITEAPNEEDKEYSGARLADVLRNAQGRAAKEINDRVLESVARFVGGTPQRDDYTLVSIRCR
jgi:sigma-B regulation protein RsbU (phosphoserine phosphatase)